MVCSMPEAAAAATPRGKTPPPCSVCPQDTIPPHTLLARGPGDSRESELRRDFSKSYIRCHFGKRLLHVWFVSARCFV